VPDVIEFAGMKLHINSTAQKQIQADVDNLRRYDSYFQKKLQKVDLHFPIIERVFKEENVPDDFKYLIIQESALVSDAISSSNAVGFWQFKKETALEMNLRVDNLVDERLNLVSSTRAAAKYLKKNNFYYDNWVYALIAYNTGRGGAEKYLKEKEFGKKRMDITGNTHWYVKKFLAHKIAFQDEIGKSEKSPYFLFEYTEGGNKDLKEIAKDFDADPDLLYEYNKCFKKRKVPNDKAYVVLVPIGFDKAELIAKNSNNIYKQHRQSSKESNSVSLAKYGSPVKAYYSEADLFPTIKHTDSKEILIVNGKKGTIAKPGDSFDVLAVTGDISLDKFLNYNDLTDFDQVIPGQVYYFQKKSSKGKTHYHTLKPGETLWEISQKYGVKLKKILTKNRLNSESDAKPGLVLWLRYIRPKNIPAEYHDVRPFENKTEEVIVAKNVHTVSGIKEPESVDPEPDSLVDTELKKDPSEDTLSDKTQHIEVFGDSESERMERKKILTEDTEDEAEETTPVEYQITHHVVQKGETFFSISRKYQVDIVDLLGWNDMKINDVLSIGQSLTIKTPVPSQIEVNDVDNPVTDPAPAQANAQMIIHVVSDTDTLYGIAKKYQVTIKEIMNWNQKEDFVIKPEEELKIFLK